MSRVLNAILTHQPPAETARLAAWWGHVAPPESLLIAHGGAERDFAALTVPHKIHVASERLRTTDHSRERQSYTGVFAAISKWMAGRDFTHVYFAEFDHLPLVADLDARLLGRLAAEKADVLVHSLRRVDETGWHHYLYHRKDPEFHRHWERISRRGDKRAVFSMLGTGTFWTREAFEAVASAEEPFPIYLEIYLPTLAHHLGYRVRNFAEHDPYVRHQGNFRRRIREARLAGAWTIHPVKSLEGLRWGGE